MKFKYLFFLIFNLVLINSCFTQEKNDITLEGKWKVIDWTYLSFVGRSLDNEEIEGIEEDLNDLILDFKLNQIFTSNKPNDFSFLENKKFIVNDYNEVVIDNQPYYFSIINDKCFFFLSNIILQIEKLEDYTGSKIKFKKAPANNFKALAILNRKMKLYDEVYLIEELDVPPKIKDVNFDESCAIDCLYNSFNTTLMYYIDYSKIDKDVSFFINFIIDKTGEINNIKIQSKLNKNNIKGKRFSQIINESQKNEEIEFSDIKESIVRSILDFQNILISGFKDDKKVNTKLFLELRLISK